MASEYHIKKRNLCKPIYDKIESSFEAIKKFWSKKDKSAEINNDNHNHMGNAKDKNKDKHKDISYKVTLKENEKEFVYNSHVNTTSKSKIIEEELCVLKRISVSSEPYNIEDESEKLKESFGIIHETKNLLNKKRSRKSLTKEFAKPEIEQQNNLCEKILTNSCVSLTVTGSNISQLENGQSLKRNYNHNHNHNYNNNYKRLTRSQLESIDDDLKVFIQYYTRETPFLKKFKLNK